MGVSLPPLRDFQSLDAGSQARIRKNLALLQAKGASEADLESYLHDDEHLAPAGGTTQPSPGAVHPPVAPADDTRTVPHPRSAPAQPPSQNEPGVGTKMLGVLAALDRDIPGAEAAQAGVRALVRTGASKLGLPVEPESYEEARKNIRHAEDAAPTVATLPARLGGAALATATGARALGLGVKGAGALYGGLSGLTDSNPDESLSDRAFSAGLGAAGGFVAGGVGEKVLGKIATQVPASVTQAGSRLAQSAVQGVRRAAGSAGQVLRDATDVSGGMTEAGTHGMADELADKAGTGFKAWSGIPPDPQAVAQAQRTALEQEGANDPLRQAVKGFQQEVATAHAKAPNAPPMSDVLNAFRRQLGMGGDQSVEFPELAARFKDKQAAQAAEQSAGFRADLERRLGLKPGAIQSIGRRPASSVMTAPADAVASEPPIPEKPAARALPSDFDTRLWGLLAKAKQQVPEPGNGWGDAEEAMGLAPHQQPDLEALLRGSVKLPRPTPRAGQARGSGVHHLGR